MKNQTDRGQTVDRPWNGHTGTWNAHTRTWKGHTGTWTGGSKIPSFLFHVAQQANLTTKPSEFRHEIYMA